MLILHIHIFVFGHDEDMSNWPSSPLWGFSCQKSADWLTRASTKLRDFSSFKKCYSSSEWTRGRNWRDLTLHPEYFFFFFWTGMISLFVFFSLVCVDYISLMLRRKICFRYNDYINLIRLFIKNCFKLGFVFVGVLRSFNATFHTLISLSVTQISNARRRKTLFYSQMAPNTKHWFDCKLLKTLADEVTVRGSSVSGKACDCRGACKHLEIAQDCPEPPWPQSRQNNATPVPGRWGTGLCSDPCWGFPYGSRARRINGQVEQERQEVSHNVKTVLCTYIIKSVPSSTHKKTLHV